jgi:1-acyl-sn-glycerol-3-phosphate acyltransferase
LLPFKKGPFYMAMESGALIIPMTILGTKAIWPKGRFAIRPETATVVFHSPIDPRNYQDRESLVAAVRESIASVL